MAEFGETRGERDRSDRNRKTRRFVLVTGGSHSGILCAGDGREEKSQAPEGREGTLRTGAGGRKGALKTVKTV